MPLAPVTSLAPQAQFAPSPAGMPSPLGPGLPALDGRAPGSLAAGLMAPQAQGSILCPPPAVLGGLPRQPVSAAAGPQPMGYMGSFLFDPTKPASDNREDEKARLQLLSLIQGAMASSCSAMQTSVPSALVSVAGGCAAPYSTPSQQQQHQQQQQQQQQQPRVIRVVLDKALQPGQNLAARLAAGTMQPLVRIVQVSSSGPAAAAAAVAAPTVAPLPPPPTLSSLLPSTASQGNVAGFNLSRGGLVQQSSLPALLMRKRTASATPPTFVAPPLKRALMLPVEKNGIIQGRFGDLVQPSCLQDKMMQPVAARTSASTSVQSSPHQASASSSSHLREMLGKEQGVALSREQANSALAGVRNLLKHHLPSHARKQGMLIRKEVKAASSGMAKKAKAKAKPKAVRIPLKKKPGRKPKGECVLCVCVRLGVCVCVCVGVGGGGGLVCECVCV